MKRITPPATLPLEKDEVKEYLRIDDDDEDDLIDSLIQTAIDWVEHYLNKALISQTWEELLHEWPEGDYIQLYKGPLQEVSEIEYMLAGESAYTAFEEYIEELHNERIYLNYGEQWPSGSLDDAAGIRIEWTAGYGDAPENIPCPIIQAMKLLISHWFENRETQVVGTIAANLEFSVRALLAPYRSRRFR